jgi:hypothetical protein
MNTATVTLAKKFDYELYKADSGYRNACLTDRQFVGGTHDKAYQFFVGDQRVIVRHNHDGSYTWIF